MIAEKYDNFCRFISLPTYSSCHFGYSNRCVVVSHCCLKLYFPHDIYVEHPFMCFFAVYIAPLVRCLFKSFVHFWEFLCIYLLCVLCTFWIRAIYVFGEHFLPICGLCFHSVSSVFCTAEVLNFYKVQLINYFFHESCLCCCI